MVLPQQLEIEKTSLFENLAADRPKLLASDPAVPQKEAAPVDQSHTLVPGTLAYSIAAFEMAIAAFDDNNLATPKKLQVQFDPLIPQETSFDDGYFAGSLGTLDGTLLALLGAVTVKQ